MQGRAIRVELVSFRTFPVCSQWLEELYLIVASVFQERSPTVNVKGLVRLYYFNKLLSSNASTTASQADSITWRQNPPHQRNPRRR